MLLEPDPQCSEWLTSWADAPAFDWDTGNSTKNGAKHGVSVDQIESIFNSVFVFLGRIVEPPHAELRWIVLGRISDGRLMALVFTTRGTEPVLLRPISCRPMRAKEKKFYEDLEK